MKNKLLLSSLLSLSILTFSGTAKAQESADATFTGTLSASTEVIKLNDGSAVINPDTGDFQGIISLPAFRVTTSQPNGTDGVFSVASVEGAPTLNQVEGVNFIALTNGTPSSLAIDNALSLSPNAPDNPDVIAYPISVSATEGDSFVFNNGNLEGNILDEPGTTDVGVFIQNPSRTDTFDSNDSAGEYTADLTLTAVGSL